MWTVGGCDGGSGVPGSGVPGGGLSKRFPTGLLLVVVIVVITSGWGSAVTAGRTNSSSSLSSICSPRLKKVEVDS